MKRLVSCLVVVGGSVLAVPSAAELGALDTVPAATLLLPAFEVDLGDPDGNGVPNCAKEVGVTTTFSISNASDAPALAHVTLWTDWSFPSLDFDVYLTGYDVQTINLCRVLGLGELPVTADVQADPNDVISPAPWGDDISFPGCQGVFPFPIPIVTGPLLDRVQNGHAGFPVPSLGGECVGEAHNGAGACSGGSCPEGTIARGYVTIDSVSECSTVFPNEPGYFEPGGLGIANNRNTLWGDYFVVDPANDFAQGDSLVHIEADASLGGGAGNGGANTSTGYTFYGRYTFPTGSDNREPLGTTWAARYLNGGPFDGGTRYSVWRDSTDGTVNSNDGFACGLCVDGAGPDWCPMNETQVVCFDEAEDCEELCFLFGGGVISPPTDPTDPTCFPLEANLVSVGQGFLTPSWNFGWCYLNLNHTYSGAPGGAPWPPGGGPIAQSYVSVLHSALGRYSVGHSAVALTGATSMSNTVLDSPGN